MTKEQTKQSRMTLPSSDTDVPVSKKSSARSLSGGLALIVAMLALMISAYLWYMLPHKQGQLGNNLSSRLDQMDAAISTLKSNAGTTAKNLAATREMQESLKNSLNRISAEIGKSRGEWALAETEQLLLIANDRLQLVHDAGLALAALRAADQQLKQFSDPQLLSVRTLLSEEIRQVESLNAVDIPGTTLALSSIAHAIDTLPLATEATFKKTPATTSSTITAPSVTTNPPTKNAWWQFVHEMWHDFTSLIRVRNDVQVRQPLLPPEENYFLRKNLQLMLYGAQLALLEHNDTTYRENIKSARQWIKDYFDLRAQSVINMGADLDKMLAASHKIETPDISASLDALHKAMANRKQAP